MTPSPVRLDARALDVPFEVAARQVADGTAPFVILGVANAAGTIRLEAVSRGGEPRIGSDAVCLVASITKPVVAAAIMQLVAEGRLALTTPLDALLPGLLRAGRMPFTTWHVLTHTSGLGEVDVEDAIRAGDGPPEYLRRVHELPNVTPPGARFEYVTATFALLAELLERLDGVPFPDALRHRILEPLGMSSTSFDPRPELGARMAPVTVGAWDGTVRPVDASQAPALEGFIHLALAGGGLWSTAADLLRFGRAMLRGGELDGARVLSPAIVALMTREVTVDGLGAAPDPLLASHYALGWGRPGIATPGSRAAFGHGGVTGTRLWVDPEHDLVFVYLTGTWGFPNEPVDEALAAVYAALRPGP